MRSDRFPNLTRREAMAAGLATAGVLALGGRVRGNDTPSGYGPFKMGIQSFSLRHFKLEDALAKTKDLGLHYWESFVSHIPPDADDARIAAIKTMADGAGVKVIGYGVCRFTKDHEANRRLFEFGRKLGVEYFSADPDPDSFDSLDKLVEEHGIGLGIHNHGPGHQYAKIDAIAAAIKGHHPKIGCCLDTGHFLRAKEDPLRAVEVFEKRIYGVHLKDVKAAETFTILGQGDLRTADLLKALAKQGYRYCLALEYEENEAMPMDDLRACLDAVRKAVATI